MSSPAEEPEEQPDVERDNEAEGVASGEQVQQRASLVGRVLGERFRVIERIAAGGMGVVYLAEQMPLGRKVAVKVLSTGNNVEEANALRFRERFLLEAASVARLTHPNTIVVHDYGSVDDLCYIVMEYIPGLTLSREVDQNGPMAPARALQIAVQITGSLQEAHEMGMVHRDLKPGNIMLTRRSSSDEFVKVLDFGLVKSMDDEGHDLTHSDAIIGSPRYMAPEQIQGTRVDARTDVYSFGTVLYHMLTGTAPFTTGSRFQILAAHINDPPPPLRVKYPRCDASARLETLVMRCLAKRQEDRPQSMKEVGRELLGCMADLGLSISGMSGIQGSVAAFRSDASGEVPVPRHINAGAGSASISQPLTGEDSNSGPMRSGAGALAAAPAAPAVVAAPAGNARSGRGGLVIGVVAALALAGAGAYWALASRGSTPPSTAATSGAPAASATPGGASGATPAATLQPVSVVTDPAGAHVRRGERDLGDTPLTLMLPRGEHWTIEIERPGFTARSVQVSAGQGELSLRLEPVPTSTATNAAGSTAASANTGAGASANTGAGASATNETPERSAPEAHRTSSGAAHARVVAPQPRTTSATHGSARPAGGTTPAAPAGSSNAHPEGWSGTHGDNRDPWAQ